MVLECLLLPGHLLYWELSLVAAAWLDFPRALLIVQFPGSLTCSTRVSGFCLLQLANERLEHHPEVIRFAAENLRLAEEVRSLVEFVGGDKEALQKEIHHLRSQVRRRA